MGHSDEIPFTKLTNQTSKSDQPMGAGHRSLTQATALHLFSFLVTLRNQISYQPSFY